MPYAKRVVFVLFNLLFLAFLYQLTSLGSFKSSFNELTRFHQLGDSNPKFLFCIVLTTPKGIREKALFALNLWIYRCSDYKIITVIPDVLNSTSNSSRKEFTREPLNLHQPVGYNQENYEKLTDKVIRAFRDIYKTHGDSFDWYFKVDGIQTCCSLFISCLTTAVSKMTRMLMQTICGVFCPEMIPICQSHLATRFTNTKSRRAIRPAVLDT